MFAARGANDFVAIPRRLERHSAERTVFTYHKFSDEDFAGGKGLTRQPAGGTFSPRRMRITATAATKRPIKNKTTKDFSLPPLCR